MEIHLSIAAAFGTTSAGFSVISMKTMENIKKNYVVLSCPIAVFVIRFALTFVLIHKIYCSKYKRQFVYQCIMSVCFCRT